MKENFRQSMGWLHTWSGLSVCWLLLLVFVAGTASFYKEEITYWMQPELHAAAAVPVPPAQAAGRAIAALQARAPAATRWVIDLPGERHHGMTLRWTVPALKDEKPAARQARGRQQTITLDPATGLELAPPRATRGGEFLYRLHYDLHYMPAAWARWIVGIGAMFMLVAIISGVITHKHIFKDFFTFRPKKGPRSWRDAHNALAVLALPFHLMITYTGLVTLMLLLMPVPAQRMYPDAPKAFAAALFPNDAPAIVPTGMPQPLASLAPMLAQASMAWGGQRPEAPARILIANPGDANARVTMVRQPGKQLSNTEPSMVFDGVSGELLSGTREVSIVTATFRSFYGLHVAHFATPLLRALFFICGLAGCAMVATGALLWGLKARQKYAKRLAQGGRVGWGVRLVDALNIGAIAGLPIAFGAYFWANRLLPVGLAQRIDAEASCFFAAWGLAAILAQINPTRRMWQLQLGIGAVLLAGIPVLNLLTATTHPGAGLIASLLHAQRLDAVAVFDLVNLLLGLLLAAAAWALHRKNTPAPIAADTTTLLPASAA